MYAQPTAGMLGVLAPVLLMILFYTSPNTCLPVCQRDKMHGCRKDETMCIKLLEDALCTQEVLPKC